MFSENVAALRNVIDRGELVLPVTEGVEEFRVNGVPVGTDQAVRGPYAQDIAVVGGESFDVFNRPLPVSRIGSLPFRIGAGDIRFRDECKRCRMIPVTVDPPDRMRDMQSAMAVHGGDDVIEIAADTPDHFRQTGHVLVGSFYVELTGGVAEIDLTIDGKQNDFLVFTHTSTSC